MVGVEAMACDTPKEISLTEGELEELRKLDSRQYGFINFNSPEELLRKNLMHKGVAYLEQQLIKLKADGNASAAVAVLKDSRGESVRIYSMLGHLNLLLDDFTAALSAYQMFYGSENEHWKDSAFLYGLGLVYYHYGMLQWATKAFQDALYSDPSFLRANEIHFRLGMINKHNGDHDTSLKHYRLALNDSSPLSFSKSEVRLHMAHLYEMQKDEVQARDAYEQLLEVPDLTPWVRSTALRQLGWLYHCHETLGDKQTRMAKAIQCLQYSLQADPYSGQSWYFLGRCYSSINKVHDAFVSYRQSIDKSEANADTWCSIGILYQQQNQPMDALQAYICAVQLDKSHTSAWINLGQLYEASTQPWDAMQCYSNAAKDKNVSEHILTRLRYLQTQLALLSPQVIQEVLLKRRQSNGQGPPLLPSFDEAFHLPIPAKLTSRQLQHQHVMQGDGVNQPGTAQSSQHNQNHVIVQQVPHGAPMMFHGQAMQPQPPQQQQHMLTHQQQLQQQQLQQQQQQLQQQQQQQAFGMPGTPMQQVMPGQHMIQPGVVTMTQVPIVGMPFMGTPQGAQIVAVSAQNKPQQEPGKGQVGKNKKGSKRKSPEAVGHHLQLMQPQVSLPQQLAQQQQQLQPFYLSPQQMQMLNWLQANQASLNPMQQQMLHQLRQQYFMQQQHVLQMQQQQQQQVISLPNGTTGVFVHRQPTPGMQHQPAQFTLANGGLEPGTQYCLRMPSVVGPSPPQSAPTPAPLQSPSGIMAPSPAGHFQQLPPEQTLVRHVAPPPMPSPVMTADAGGGASPSVHMLHMQQQQQPCTTHAPPTDMAQQAAQQQHPVAAVAGAADIDCGLPMDQDCTLPPQPLPAPMPGASSTTVTHQEPSIDTVQGSQLDVHSKNPCLMPQSVPAQTATGGSLHADPAAGAGGATGTDTASEVGAPQQQQCTASSLSSGKTELGSSSDSASRLAYEDLSLTAAQLLEGVKGRKDKGPPAGSPCLLSDLRRPPAPPQPPSPLAKEEIRPTVSTFTVETRRDALSSNLQQQCMAQPIAVARGLASILRLDLGLFSTKTLVDTSPEQQVEVRTQRKQSSDENVDSNGVPTWRCESSRSYSTIIKYAQYQAASFQESLRDESEKAKAGTTSNAASAIAASKGSDSDSSSSAASRGRRKYATIKFGTNVDLSDEQRWQTQLAELAKLPPWLRVQSAGNMLSHLGHCVLGVNSVQLYMKVPGCRTPGHQENNNFCSVNINIGPGDCEWFGVPEPYWGTVHNLCERNSVNYLSGSWWPLCSDLAAENVPLYKFVQKPGDLVWVNAGTVHWVQATGWCNNIAWNVAPLDATVFRMAIERYEWNKLQSYKSIVPMVHLSWNLARNIRISDPELYTQVKLVLMRTLKQTEAIRDYMENLGHEIMWRGRQDNEAPHYCYNCEVEVFNLLCVREVDRRHVVHCLDCALKVSPGLGSGFSILRQHKTEDLATLYDKFQLAPQPPTPQAERKS